MSKKQELINELITKMQSNGVEFDKDYPIRTHDTYWEQHPDGYVSDGTESFESDLVGLDNSNLELILASDIQPGLSSTAIWREWGKAGLLKIKPKVLCLDKIPVLQLRHSAYLSWFRGYRFQVSGDACGYCDCGSSMTDLASCLQATADWDEPLKWAMPLSHAIEATGRYSEFIELAVSEDGQSLVNDFFRKTSKVCRIYCDEFDISRFFDSIRNDVDLKDSRIISLSDSNNRGAYVFAQLYLKENAIGVRVFNQSIADVATICFPTYEKAMPIGIEKQEYLRLVWYHFSIILLGLNRIILASHYMCPKSLKTFTWVDAGLYKSTISDPGLNGLWSRVEELSKQV